MITPDISEFTVTDASNLGPMTRALKDYFDGSITDPSNVNEIENYDSNHNSFVSNRFDLVNNTNTEDSFTITPTASGESFHINLSYSFSFDDINALIDPQAGITDAGDNSSGSYVTSSTGEPEESGVTTLINDSRKNFVVVEFDDALIFLLVSNSLGSVIGEFYIGKHLRYLQKSFRQNLGGFMVQNREIQLDKSNWVNSNNFTTLNPGWIDGNLYFNPDFLVESEVPNVSSGFRALGVSKYFYRASIPDYPGIVARAGSSNTSFVYTGSDPNTTYNTVIPWDPNYSPMFS